MPESPPLAVHVLPLHVPPVGQGVPDGMQPHPTGIWTKHWPGPQLPGPQFGPPPSLSPTVLSGPPLVPPLLPPPMSLGW